MFDLQSLTTFLGWCSLINVGILLLSTAIILFAKRTILQLHSQMFSVTESQLNQLYLQFIAHYKMLILIFNLVPYIALKLMQ